MLAEDLLVLIIIALALLLIGIGIGLDSKIKMLPCVANDKGQVKSVLLELLFSILEESKE